MKTQMMIGLVALGLITGCATHEDRDMRESSGAELTRMGTQFDELPAAVQSTINAQAPGAKIADIDKEQRSGRTVYEIQFAEPGKNPKLHIAEDGSLIKGD